MSAYDVRPFPPPPPAVRDAIEQLHLASTHPPTDEWGLQRLAMLPRPWDPGSCPSDLLAELWPWIGDIVDWLNSQWLTADDAGLPPCWPDHPDLCQWLPVLAAARYEVGYGVTPGAVRDWIAFWYPEIVSRSARLHRCRLGRHHPH